MANLKDLIVNGAARVIGKVYAPEFVGNLTGNAVLVDETTVDIYIKKTEAYDAISIMNCECPNYLSRLVRISYPFTFAESVPSGATAATCPAYMGVPGLYGAVFN